MFPTFLQNFLNNNFNGYSSYMDGNLPFDINDFKRDENAKVSSKFFKNCAM